MLFTKRHHLMPTAAPKGQLPAWCVASERSFYLGTQPSIRQVNDTEGGPGP